MNCASPSKPPPPRPAEAGRRWKKLGISCYRLGVIAAAFCCLHLTTQKREKDHADLLDGGRVLPIVRSCLPAADALGVGEGDDRLSPATDRSGEIIGWVGQTSPEANGVTGYAGPSNLLVIFDAQRRVMGTALLESCDTAGHVAKVAADDAFFSQWNGRSEASLGAPEKPVIVSGASLTSEAMARGLAARFGAKGMDEWFPGETSIEDAKAIFAQAATLEGERVLDRDGKLLGLLLRSSRMGVGVRGFQGAQDLLVGLDPNGGSIVKVHLIGSRDNEPYISDVKEGIGFDTPFAGMTVEEAMRSETGSTVMVSGASRTAESVEETVKEMLRRHAEPVKPEEAPVSARDAVALAWIGCGLLIGLGPWRGQRRLRSILAVASVLLGGLWLGLMTGQDQWIKWSMQGRAGPVLPLIALSVAALLVPALFGRNVYCAQICPHGAAQQLLGHLRKRRFALPARLHRVMKGIPWVLLLGLWLAAFLGIAFPFSHAEPFEIWSAGFVALVPVLIFAVGLIAAVFLPQAYCHYGCPTGAVLRFLASSPGRWTRRDSAAGVIVGFAWLVFLLR